MHAEKSSRSSWELTFSDSWVSVSAILCIFFVHAGTNAFVLCVKQVTFNAYPTLIYIQTHSHRVIPKNSGGRPSSGAGQRFRQVCVFCLFEGSCMLLGDRIMRKERRHTTAPCASRRHRSHLASTQCLLSTPSRAGGSHVSKTSIGRTLTSWLATRTSCSCGRSVLCCVEPSTVHIPITIFLFALRPDFCSVPFLPS